MSNAWGGQNASTAAGNAWDNQDQSPSTDSWGGPVAPDGAWSSGQLSFPQTSWQDPAGSGAQQPSFTSSGVQPSGNSFWTQNPNLSGTPGALPAGQSLLPVPYQGQPGPASQALMVMPTGFPTIGPGVQPVNSLVPALPGANQEALVYVSPMYTKPRPIIPRYRAISGLISVILVSLLLCSGAGYYVQVTGKLAFLEKLLGFYTPPAIASGAHTLPVPSNQVIYNTSSPAAKVITSVGLSNSVSSTGLIPTFVNQFSIGQLIYLTCGTNTSQAGTVTVWWYTNDNRYREQVTSIPANKQNTLTVLDHIVFGQATEGKAEIYWNDELAATVLFVVEPTA